MFNIFERYFSLNTNVTDRRYLDGLHEALEPFTKAQKAQIAFYLTRNHSIIAGGNTTFQVDGVLKIKWKDKQLEWPLIFKNTASPTVLNWALQLEAQGHGRLWITPYWNPVQQEQLRARNVNYADLAGNLFLTGEGIYVHISGKKPAQKPAVNKDRAYFKEGLKVVLMLLADSRLAQATNRELAQKAGVSLGTVNNTLASLKEQMILIEAPLEKTWHLFNRETLLNEFADAYPRRLKPACFAGRYRTAGNEPPPYHHKKAPVRDLLWSGEPGADLVMNNLRPEAYILYTRLSRQDLIKTFRLLPDDEGDTEAYFMFWPEDIPGEMLPGIQHILIYADLISSASARNHKVAAQVLEIIKASWQQG